MQKSMKTLKFCFLACLSCLAAGQSVCELKRTQPNEQFPDLETCQYFTDNSCCTNSHDETIGESFEGLISGSCSGLKFFDYLKVYFCFGCYEDQPLYISTDNSTSLSTLFICKEFAQKIYGAPLDGVTLEYDDCGINLNDDIQIASLLFNNATEFFQNIKPPFFDNYVIDFSRSENCYSSAFLTRGLFSLFVIL